VTWLAYPDQRHCLGDPKLHDIDNSGSTIRFQHLPHELICRYNQTLLAIITDKIHR
jgi:hypothetical protein